MEGRKLNRNRRLRVAIYLRLSKEDEILKNESNSIRMQRILLEEYAASHFENYRLMEFQDDGYSGTNFNRPGISALLELVKKSAVDCILVKDFSRFSRDYIELGSYINQILPFMGVRFISVNDNYDSADGVHEAGDMDISFKSLLYDLYSKDLSVKIKASLAARKEKGEYVSGNSPFGYEKAPDDRHMLLIEEEEAAIVRRIFRLASEGKTSNQIARLFNEEGVKTPVQYKIEKGKTSRAPKSGRFMWSSGIICRILRNEIYAGDIVYGKTYKEGVGGKNHLKPREEWKIFHNHHEPVIDRETFCRIQQGRGRKRPEVSAKRHPLTGKLLCGCCGRSLRIRNGLNPYFICPNVYECPGKDCVQKANAMFLEQYVMFEVQNRVLESADRESLWEKIRTDRKRELIALKAKKADVQAELFHLQEEKRRQYETYKEGKENTEESFTIYREEKCVIKDKEKMAGDCLREIGNAMESMEEKLERKQNDSELLTYLGLSELTEPAVRKLIKNIVVHDERHMEICWNETRSSNFPIFVLQ